MPGTPGTPSSAFYTYTNLPTELQNYQPFASADPTMRLSAGATLTYIAAWSASATTPQIAYWWEAIAWSAATNEAARQYGVGWVKNASVSTTPVPILLGAHWVYPNSNAAFTGAPTSAMGIYSGRTQGAVAVLAEDLFANGLMNFYNDLGFITLTLWSNVDLSPGTADQIVGGGVSSWGPTGQQLNPLGWFPAITVTAAVGQA